MMRHVIVGLLVSGLAFAQSDEGDDDEGGGPPEGSMTARPGGAAGPGTQHTVERGDTLWDLSQKYLGSPWYWPKVWSYNPEIANPHWIYPGNVVRFFGTGEETPTQVELGSAPDVAAGELIDEDAVQVGGKLAYEPKGALLYRVAGFITPKEIEEAGRLAGSFFNGEYLSPPNNAYIELKNKGTAKIGDRYVIFRPGEEVDNPNSGRTVGYLTILTGIARVTRTDGPMVTVQITDGFDIIQRGDLVAPYSEALLKRVAVRMNDKRVDATLVAQLGMGTYQTIIIDAGSDQGVQPGNVFTVIRQQDGLAFEVAIDRAYRDESFPEEEVAHCVAWEVKSGATSCVVVNAMRELVVGDMVRMIPAGSSGPGASR